ncbi:hypothetical protein FKM82_025837 [Ascaphus truei]
MKTGLYLKTEAYSDMYISIVSCTLDLPSEIFVLQWRPPLFSCGRFPAIFEITGRRRPFLAPRVLSMLSAISAEQEMWLARSQVREKRQTSPYYYGDVGGLKGPRLYVRDPRSVTSVITQTILHLLSKRIVC